MNNFTVSCNPDTHAPYVQVKVSANDREYVGWGLIDTGCAKSAMTVDVKECLGFADSEDTHEAYTAGGTVNVPYYFVDIILENNVKVENVMIDLFTSYKNGPKFLIGMDIISKGNLAITNYNGDMIISFEIPSRGTIDFQKM